MSIRLIITGGTIDKKYNPISQVADFEKTHVPKMIAQSNCAIPIEIEELMLIDSLDMTEQDRVKILERVKNAPEDMIVITHGTDTKIETAQALAKEITDKTIVLFGALIPYSFIHSDALFNFGSAVSAVQTLPKGVYITMNGKIFPWDQVKKNLESGEFEKL